ncbi:MAG: hypothetical protein A2Z14_03420 [Chloroflexi bacterium RBG_16_48_8]|nr:MAG: hypothetical protein A2Z14_03420 [Chloroflexi bacterium RBG_16_48_8]
MQDSYDALCASSLYGIGWHSTFNEVKAFAQRSIVLRKGHYRGGFKKALGMEGLLTKATFFAFPMISYLTVKWGVFHMMLKIAYGVEIEGGVGRRCPTPPLALGGHDATFPEAHL